MVKDVNDLISDLSYRLDKDHFRNFLAELEKLKKENEVRMQ